MRAARTLIAGAIATMGWMSSAQAIEFVFDYSYDTTGYMTAERRAILEQAASVLESRITDELTAIGPDGTFRSRIFFSPPETGFSANDQNAVIGTNQLRVYVGARDLGEASHVSAGGVASPTGGSGDEYQAYRAEMMSRGQTGALANPATDFGPWGGSLAFNGAMDYYLDSDLSTVEAFEGYDFYTASLRGLIGILGFGGGTTSNTAGSYTAQADQSKMLFKGANAVAANGGGGVALDGQSYRFLGNSVSSTVDGVSQTVLMTRLMSEGERREITDLEWAILSDIGWQIAPVPEPSEYALFLAGLGVIAAVARRRKV